MADIKEISIGSTSYNVKDQTARDTLDNGIISTGRYFNPDVFTVVGSPKITDDGIASDFSSSNYVYNDFNFSDHSSLRIEFRNITCLPETTTRNKCFFEFETNGDVALRLYKGTEPTANVFLVYPQSGYGVYYSGLSNDTSFSGFVEIKDGKIYSTINNVAITPVSLSSAQLSAIFTAGRFSLGATTHAGSLQFSNGSIDLKQFSVTVDGIKVLDGSKYLIQDGNLDTETVNEKMHALKCYPNEGKLLTDRQGLEAVKSYNRSTFDLSKFTVTGTPTITADGIASNLSSSNRITSDFTSFLVADNWRMEYPISVTQTIESGLISLLGVNALQVVYTPADKKISFALSSNGTSWDIINADFAATNLDTSRDSLFVIEYTGTQYILNVYQDGVATGIGYTVNNSNKIYAGGGDLIFGNNRGGGSSTNGSIDLKQFSITVDGVEVFNGNKTGVDIIKADDFTVVGTPTISADGVASGFSNSNYLRTSTIDFTKPWEITSKFLVNASGEGYLWGIQSGGWFNYNYLGNLNNTTFTFKLSDNSEKSLKTSYLKGTNVYYVYIVGWNGTTYYTKLYDNNGVLLEEHSIDSTLTLNNTSGYVQLGYGSSGNYTLNGSVDLNEFKIIVDGNLVYQPLLKIPYNQSKTGLKIVQSAYRDRVQDMYNQYGWANYYTLSDTDFTLPMGENLDGHVTKVDWYKNGVTSWEYDTNLDCIETGNCTSGTAVTLPKPMADDTYSLSVPYSAKSKTGFTPTATGDYIAKGKVVLG